MKIVIFGLTISSSWGNGHATLWRGLTRALIGKQHEVVFLERDVPYYASHRDFSELPGGILDFYSSWDDLVSLARPHLEDADVAMVTSYCPDGAAVCDLVLSSPARLRVFYDLDTPITLEQLRSGQQVPYVPMNGLAEFDLVLSYTGGVALDELQSRLGARRVAPLYGSVDPAVHRPVPPNETFRCDLSYLGTYARDRQAALEELFVRVATRMPHQRFFIGGAQYPTDFPWSENIFFVSHVAPGDHPAFYCSSRWTLSVTRKPMAEMGYCPSGRLFEAAACATPLISDGWPGLEDFFCPGEEIVVARSDEDVRRALQLSDGERHRIGAAARRRVLSDHTANQRAGEFERLMEEAGKGKFKHTTLIEA